ncbi:hypothetical protein T492DRAFT_918829, partial [Pavlovales sp. CCMP2436]
MRQTSDRISLTPACGSTTGEPLGRARTARAVSPSAGTRAGEGGWRPVGGGVVAPGGSQIPRARESAALGLRTPGASWADGCGVGGWGSTASATVADSHAEFDAALLRGRAVELGTLLHGDVHSLAGLMESVRRSIEESTVALQRNMLQESREVDGGALTYAQLAAEKDRADSAEAKLLEAQSEIATLSAELTRAQSGSPTRRRVTILSASAGRGGNDGDELAAAATKAAAAAMEAAVATAKRDASADQAKLAAQLMAAAKALEDGDKQLAALEEQLADAEANSADAHESLREEREERAALQQQLEPLQRQVEPLRREREEHADLEQQLERLQRELTSAAASRLDADIVQREHQTRLEVGKRDAADLGRQVVDLSRQLADERMARARAEIEATAARAVAERLERAAAAAAAVASAAAAAVALVEAAAATTTAAVSAVAVGGATLARFHTELALLARVISEAEAQAEAAVGLAGASGRAAEQALLVEVRAMEAASVESEGRLAEATAMRAAAASAAAAAQQQQARAVALAAEGALLAAARDAALLAAEAVHRARSIAEGERDGALVQLHGVARDSDSLRRHAAHGVRDAASARELAAAKQRELRGE